LRDLICQVDYYYGMDTGVYHLAVAMGVEATVFFGPTQPLVAIMPQQTKVASIRLEVLQNDHCDIVDCACPLCLYQAVDSFVDAPCATPLEATPARCPLRAFAPAALPPVTLRRHPPA
jgi:ADP-heptose:LPS heptosyltransferase